ncbi:MAG: hypothetical protein IJF16_06235 [Clostridia bacterium]|nr:hypothetical protein [Clostridia bacterium]
MTQWIVSSSALIIIVVLIRQLLKNRLSLKIRYALWLLVLIRLIVPVSFGQSPVSIMNTMPDMDTLHFTEAIIIASPATQTPILPPGDHSTAPSADHHHEQASAASVNYDELALGIYVLGAAIFALWFVFCNLYFYFRLLRSRRRIRVVDFPLKVYALRWIETPCLFGIFAPSVYITPKVIDDGTKLRHVLAHELTHFYHGDHIWSCLRGAAVALHWYNPLVWLAASLSRRDCELACDEGTIGRIGENERVPYGDTLIGLTVKKRSLASILSGATTMVSGKRAIYERVKLIAKRPKTAVFALIVLLLLTLIAAACTFTGASRNKPDNSLPADIAAASPAPEVLEPLVLPSSSPAPTAEPEPSALMTFTSCGQTVEPYTQLRWKNTWNGEAFIFADGKPLDLEAVKDEIPEIDFDGSFSVDFPSGGSMTAGSELYNEDFTPYEPDDESLYYYGNTKLYWLDPGSYYIVFNIFGPDGAYIASEYKYEECGYYAVVKLNAGKSAYEPFHPDILKKKQLISAEMSVLGEKYTADEEMLSELVSLLGSAKKCSATGCPFSTLMYLTFSDGSVYTLCPAEDSCNVFTSDGLFFELESKKERTVWDILDVKLHFVEEEFDENGNVVKSQEYSWGMLVETVENTYTDSGLIASSKRIFSDGWVEETSYTYNSKDDLEEIAIFSNGQLHRRTEHTYNELGQLAREVTYLEDGNKYITYTYEYDDLGRMHSKAYFNHADSGNFLVVYGYDKKNRLISETTYDAIENGEYSHRYEYVYTDDGGQLSERYYYNENNSLEAVWKYEYDPSSPDSRLVYSYDGSKNFIETYRESF